MTITKEIPFINKKKVVCTDCDGEGSFNGAECRTCKGIGLVMRTAEGTLTIESIQ